MKWIYLFLAFSALGQEIDIRGGGAPVSADGLWKWKAGDNLAWAAPDFDDTAWSTVQVPGSPLPRQSGALWLRVRVFASPGQRISLGTMPLAEASELYWNGAKLSGLGKFAADGHPAFDLFPRSLIARSAVPGDGHAVIALRLHRPQVHEFFPIQLDGFSLFAGGEEAVRSWIDSHYRFPHVPLYVFVGPEFSNWLSLVLYGTVLLVGLYFIVAWYASPEVPAFLAFGANSLLFGGLVVLFAYWVDHEVSLTMGNILISLLEGGSVAAWFELHLVLARIAGPWPRLILYVPGFAGMAREVLFPDRYMPAEGFLYTSMIALPALGILVVWRNLRQPLGWVLIAGILPMTAVGTAQMTNFGRHLAGDSFDFWFLALVRQNDAAYNTVAAAILIVALGIYLQNLLENIRREKARLGQELTAASEIQKLLLPPRMAPGADWIIDAEYRPAGEVGGDFYHVMDGEFIVVGDVSGKGLRAAMLVSLLIGVLRETKERQPGAVLAALNRAVAGQMGGGFVTCCCVRLHAGGVATIANAGHLAPYLAGAEVAVDTGLPIGLDPEACYGERAVSITSGACLTILSDGIVEAENAHRELFGFDRAREISTRSAREIASAAQAWGQNDDITVVTVRRTA